MEEAGWQVQTAWNTSLDNFTKKVTLTETEQTVPPRNEIRTTQMLNSI